MGFILLLNLILPILSIPLVYLTGKRSSKSAALLLAAIAIVGIVLISTTIPTVLSSPEHKYSETYQWIPLLNSDLVLFVDGISLSMAYVALVILIAASVFSISYIQEKKRPAIYYSLLALLATGLLHS